MKTEIAEADVAELFDSVEAKQYKRPDMNGDLRLGFASDDFAGTKWKNLTGTMRWSDGTEMRLLSPHQRALGGVQGLPGPAGRVGSLAGPAGAEEQVNMEALRDLADDFNVRDPRKLYQLARQRDLDVTQAMAFEALKADVGRQVQAPRPCALGKSAAEGPNDRLQADLIDSQNTRGKTKYGLVVMDVFAREAAVEPLQNKNAELGNEFATLDRELPAEAVRRTKRPEDRNAIAVVDRGIQTLKKDLATRVARKGGQWSDHFQQTASAYNARPHETVHGAPEDVEKQPATEFRVLQDNADKFQHNKGLTNRRIKAVEDAGAFQAPTNAARSFNPQYGNVQQLRAVDSMTVRSTEGRETLLKLALPAPQGSGNTGRLTRRGRPAAVRQLDDFLAPPRPRTLD